jgi:hypothetical protein
MAEGAQRKAESTEAEILVLRGVHAGWSSAIVPDFPKLFDDFKQKQFTLLWRGSRDGFKAKQFHSRCNGHPNTLTVIVDTNGNIFGGFTPVEWDSKSEEKADPSLKSFLFTLKNPHNVPARRFALKAEKKDWAIRCDSNWGPNFNLAEFGKCHYLEISISEAIWRKGRLVRDFENFNFLHLEIRRTREHRFRVQSGVVGVTIEPKLIPTLGVCVAVIENTDVLELWTPVGTTID